MATGNCTVTPGTTIVPDGTVTAGMLNALGKPVVQLEPGSVGSGQLVKSELVDLLGTGATGYNYLDNPNLAENRWSRGSTPVTCPAAARTFRADEWWVRPTGAAVTYEREALGPNAKSLHSAKITGATSVTVVEFGQDIPRRIATALGTPILISFWLRNDIGAALTPTVNLNIPTSADNFGAVTNIASQAAAGPAGNGTWQLFELAFDLTATANLNRGLQVVIVLAGGLNSGAHTVNLAQLKLELTAETSASPFRVELERAEATAATSASVLPNLLRNGQFDSFAFPGTAGISAGAGVNTGNAPGWFCNPAGAACTLTRSTSVPANNLSLHSQRVTGAVGVNAVDVGQNFPTDQAGKLRRNVRFSLWVRYHDGLGGSMTPLLKLFTPATEGDFTGGSTQLTATLDPCPADTWTQLTYQFDGSGVSNITNGLRLAIELPSGSMDAITKYCEFAQGLLMEGTDTPALHPYLESAEPAVIGTAAALLIVSASASTLSLSCDEIVLRNPDGRALLASGVIGTIDMAATGANGKDAALTTSAWGYLYVISNGTTHAGMISSSATAPVMPAGYTYKALVGAIYISTSSVHVQIRQVGRRVWATAQGIGSFAGNTTETALDLSAFVPPTAKTVSGLLGVATNNAAAAWLRGDTTPRGKFNFVAINGLPNFDGWWGVAEFSDMPLVTPQSLLFKSHNATPSYRLDVTSWTY